MSYRHATLDIDTAAIVAALRKLQAYAQNYDFIHNINFDVAVANVLTVVEQGNAYIIDGYLVLTEFIQPWYSEDWILQEWLVLKVRSGGSVDSIPPALREIAAANACSIILTADSSPVNIVAQAYERAGFHKLTQSFCTKV